MAGALSEWMRQEAVTTLKIFFEFFFLTLEKKLGKIKNLKQFVKLRAGKASAFNQILVALINVSS